MSYAAATFVALAGVYAFAALFYGVLARLRGDSADRPLALALVGFAAYSACTAATFTATSPHASAQIQTLQMAALNVGTGLFVEVVLRIVGHPSERLVQTYVGIGVVAAAVALSGHFFDPALPSATYDWGPTGPHNRPVGEWRPAAVVLMGATLVGVAHAVVLLMLAARRRVELRPVAVATALSLALGVVDVVVRGLDRPGMPPLIPLASLLVLGGLAYVLAGRLTRIDAELADRLDELARSHDHLKRAERAILYRDRPAAVGELSAIVALEVRGPLRLVHNAVRGLRRRELRDRDRAVLLTILDEETDRLNHLIEDLMAYARPIAADAKPVDLTALVRNAVETAAGGAMDPGRLELELELEPDLAPVPGDERLLRYAVLNLIDNALSAVPRGGVLTIRCRSVYTDGLTGVAVELEDTDGSLDRIAARSTGDPFLFAGEPPELGLAIVDRVARLHGGRTFVRRRGPGTRLRFVVPRDPAARPSLLEVDTPRSEGSMPTGPSAGSADRRSGR